MKQKRKWFWIIPLVLIVVILVTMVFYRKAVRLVFYNLTVPTYELDETRDWGGGTTYMEVPYSDISSSDYVNIYVPDAEEVPPLYVIVHGGGFVANDAESRQAQLMYRYFRDHGFACASVNYRLAGEAPFPAAIEDCKAAIRFLRVHAEEYGYNADHIAVFGESAGGYLAVMCAVTNDDEFNSLTFIGQDKLGDVSAKVDVVVDYYGAIEFGMSEDISAIGLPSGIYQIANSWMNADVTQGFENVESFWLRKNLSEMTGAERALFNPYTYIEENATKFSTEAEAYGHSREVAINAQAEGTVLLENNGALPLDASERRISVFGVASVNIAFGGTGSGAGNRDSLTDLYTALESEGFAVNPVLKSFYEQKYRQGYHRGAGTDMNGAYYGIPGTRNYGYSINEVERSAYTDEVRGSYGDYADAAIIVISRSGGEGQDLPTSMAEFYEGDGRYYLELTDEETGLLEEVKSGGFGKVIVLMNTLNTFECGFLKDDGIDAALWIGGTGQHGMIAVAKMLTGELSPEGRLPDTYAADLLSAPAMMNYGDNRYVDNGEVTTAAYVAYEEGVYVGYRYYETRALDEGEEWYADQVVYGRHPKLRPGHSGLRDGLPPLR